MAKSILFITGSLLIALWTGESFAQSTTIKGGTGSTTAAVKNSALAGTEAGLVIRCASGCAGSGGTSQSDNSAVANITGMGALYDLTPPAITDGNIGAPVMDSSRRLIVNCGSGCSGSSFADNAAFAFGTTTIQPIAGVFDDTATNVATENSAAVVRITTQKGLHANLRNVAGTEIGTAGAPLRTDPTGTTGQPITNANMESYQSRLLSSAITAINGGAAAATTGFMVGGRYQSTPPTLTNGQEAGLQLDSAGALKVSGAGGGTQYAEDTAHVTGDSATMAGVVQQTADTALSTDGDRSLLQVDANGFLKVNIKAGAGSGGTAMADDAAFTPAVTSVTPTGYLFDNVTPDSVDEGDIGAGRMSANRNVYHTIRDGAGNERGANVNASNELTTSANTELPAAATMATGMAYPTAPFVLSANMCSNGTTLDPCLQSTAGNGATDANTQRVTIANNSTGTVAVTQPTGSNLHMVCDSGCSGSGGTAAADDADFIAGTTAGTPAMGVYESAPTSVTDGDLGTVGITATRQLKTSAAVTDIVPGVGATNLGKAEDAVHTSGDVGVMALGVRNDSGAVYAASNGDYSPIATTSSGAVHVGGATSVTLGKAEDAAHASGDTGAATLCKRTDTAASSAGTDGDYATVNCDANGYAWTHPSSSSATGAAPPAHASYNAGLGSGATGGFLTGIAVADSFANINVSTATTTLLVTGVSGRHVRISSLNLTTAAANNVALISGTGATCATGATGMNGGITAASGWNFAANGGITQGNGLGSVNSTNATGDSVCIVTSAATQLSGRLAYAIY